MAALTGVMTADFTGFIQEVDKSVVKLKQLESASSATSVEIDAFSDGLGQVDKTLGAMGIHIGPQIQALRELSGVLNKTVSEVGLLGTVGAATAAGIAGWEIGRMTAEFFDLDTAIARTTASLLGWGDLAAETAAAKLMNLQRASEIAGRTITDVGEALRIVSQHNAETNQSFNTGAQRVREWQGELDRVRSKLPEIQAELKNHNSTNKEIAEHYGISTRALEYYNRTLTESAKAQKAWADEVRPKYEAIRVAQEELAHATGGWHAALTAIAPATAKAAMEAMNLGVSQNTVAKALNLTTLQVDALDRQMKLNLGTMAVTEPALGSLDAWIKTNYADTKAWNSEWRFTSEVIGEQVNPALDAVTEKIEGVSTAMQESFLGPKGGGGTINTAGMTIPDQDELWRQYNATHLSMGVGTPMAPGRSDILSWGLGAGLIHQAGGAFNAPSISNVFNIVDTESNIARRVSDPIASQIQRGSLVN
jgi:hypothetical protein